MKKLLSTSVISLALLVAVVLSQGTGVQPSAMNCTQHPFVLGVVVDNTYNWSRSLIGAEVAVHAFNKRGGLYGCNFTIKMVDVTGADPQAATVGLTMQPNFITFAQLAGSAAPTAIGLGLTRSIPVFALAGFDETLFAPMFSFVIHHRNSFLTEMAVNVNYALHGPGQCNQYGFIYQTNYGIGAGTEAIARQVTKIGLPAPLLFPANSLNGTLNALNISAQLNDLPAGTAIPDCYLVLLFEEAANSVILAITKNATLYDEERTYFYGSSYIDPFRKENAQEFKNYFSTRIFPHPLDDKYTIAAKYRQHLAEFESEVVFPHGYTRSELFTNPEGMERYAQTRMILEMATRVPTAHLTPSTFLNAVYASRLFTVDDLTMGPFNKACTGGMTSASGPCFCNSGLRRLFLTRVDVANQSTIPIHNDAERFEENVAEFDLPIDRCTITMDFLKVSTHALIVTDISISRAAGSSLIAFDRTGNGAVAAQRRIVATLERSMLKARAAALSSSGGTTTPVSPITVAASTSSTSTSALTTISTQLNKMHHRYRVGVTIGSSITQANVDAAAAMAALPNQVKSLKLAPMKYVWDEESTDTSTVSFEKWDSGFIPFWPDLSSFIFTAAGYASSLGRLPSAVVLCDNANIAALVVKSWNTFGSAAPRTVVIPTSAKATRAAAVAWMKSTVLGTNAALTATSIRAASPFVLVASQATIVVEATVDISAEVDVLLSDNEKATQLFCIASSEFVLEDALSAVRASTLPTIDRTTTMPRFPANLVFTSALASYATDGVATASYATVLSALALAFIEKGKTYDARIAAIYAERRLAVSALSIGPLSNVKCATAPAGTTVCQSNAGPNRFYIRNISSATIGVAASVNSGNANDTLAAISTGSSTDSSGGASSNSGSTSAVFDSVFANGRPEFKPLPSSSSSNTLVYVVVGCAAGLTVVLVAAAAVYFFMIRKSTRDNSSAPKDSTKPFAIVFTDIQSSTMLWAHAPQHMGVALDAHHATLRTLVKENKGYEVKTIGDSFMVAFEDPQRALAFAISAQRRLYSYDWATQVFDQTYREVALDSFPEYAPSDDEYDRAWCGLRVRIGVHFGTGSITFDETTKGYDYYGTVVNTAARVEGVGHGGQVLLTAAAASAVTADFTQSLESKCADGGGAVVADLGPQPLRGLEEPVHLYQIVPSEFSGRRFPALRLDVENEIDDGDLSDISLASTSKTRDTKKDTADVYKRGSLASGKDTPGRVAPDVTHHHTGGSHNHTANAHRDGKEPSSSEDPDTRSQTTTKSLSSLPTIENAARIIATSRRSRQSPALKAQVQSQLVYGHRLLTAMFATSPAAFKTATLKKIQEKWHVRSVTSSLKRCIRNGLPRDDAALLMVIDKCRGTLDAASGGGGSFPMSTAMTDGPLTLGALPAHRGSVAAPGSSSGGVGGGGGVEGSGNYGGVQRRPSLQMSSRLHSPTDSASHSAPLTADATPNGNATLPVPAITRPANV